MSKIQIGKQATNAEEFIEGSSIFMDAEGHFVASEFIETSIPNISKMHKVTKAFETFEIIESEESPSPQFIARYNVTEGNTATILNVYYGDVELTHEVESITLDGNEIDISNVYDNIETDVEGDHELVITLKEGVDEVESFDFKNLHSLTSITIPNSVTSIGNYAFDSCTSLTSITIPNSVTSIGDSAFASCTSLTSITIPSGVTSIGSGAFRYCTSLTSITCLPTTPPSLYDEETTFEDTNCPIYVPSQSVSAYKSTGYWSYFEYRIQAIP